MGAMKVGRGAEDEGGGGEDEEEVGGAEAAGRTGVMKEKMPAEDGTEGLTIGREMGATAAEA